MLRTGSVEVEEALICTMCRFAWCKYFPHGGFQAASLLWNGLQNSWQSDNCFSWPALHNPGLRALHAYHLVGTQTNKQTILTQGKKYGYRGVKVGCFWCWINAKNSHLTPTWKQKERIELLWYIWHQRWRYLETCILIDRNPHFLQKYLSCWHTPNGPWAKVFRWLFYFSTLLGKSLI